MGALSSNYGFVTSGTVSARSVTLLTAQNTGHFGSAVDGTFATKGAQTQIDFGAFPAVAIELTISGYRASWPHGLAWTDQSRPSTSPIPTPSA